MSRLREMLVGVGVVTIGGVAYLLARPDTGVTFADLQDAGINTACSPAHLECQVRNHCRSLPDGGQRPRYGTVEVKGYYCDRDAGEDVLVMRFPQGPAGDCFEPMGPPEQACVLVENVGQCTDPAACDDSGGARPWKPAQDRCACRNADAGPCRVPSMDGGLVMVPAATTVFPPFVGAGCVRKSCTEAAGELGQSMPPECE